MKIDRLHTGVLHTGSGSKVIKAGPSIHEKDNFTLASRTNEDFQVYKDSSTEKKPAVNLENIEAASRAIAVSAASCAVSSPAAKAISIIYTNDIHGAISPVKDSKNPGQLEGGVSYMGSLIKNLKEDSKGNYVLLDGGDWGQGSYESKLTKGKTLINVMNYLGYDAAEIGNHEFDWGQGALDEMINRAEFPILGSNVLKEGKLIDGVRPYVIKEVNGIKVGILGILTTGTPGSTDPKNLEGLTFEDVNKTAGKYLPEIRENGAEFIVVLSHLGDKFDEKLARSVNGIDVIVGGHSHTDIFKPKEINGTLIVQAGTQGKKVGNLNLSVDSETKKVIKYENNLIPVTDKDFQADPEVEKIIAPVVNEAKEKLSIHVGTTQVDLTHDRKKVLETIMGNVLTDAMKEVSGADIAMQNSGGIRDQIMEGEITYGDLYRVLPFDKYMVTMELTGKQVTTLLENSAQRNKGNLQVSGITMDIEPKKPQGEKVSNIKINGIPLESDKTYKVATDDFLAGGANGYTTFAGGKNQEYGKLTVDILKDYIEKHSPLTSQNAKIEGRLNFLSPPPEGRS